MDLGTCDIPNALCLIDTSPGGPEIGEQCWGALHVVPFQLAAPDPEDISG